MSEVEQLNAIFQWAQSSPTLLYFSVALAIISVTTSISRTDDLIVRGLFYLGLAGGALYLAATQTEIPYDFFLNLSTELFGALVVGLLLNNAFGHMPASLLIAGLFGVGSTLAIDGSESLMQSSYVNLTTEIIGAYIVAVLLTRRSLLWSRSRSAKRAYQSRSNRRSTTDLPDAQDILRSRKARAQRRIIAQVEAEFTAWQADQEKWDVAVIISAKSKHQMRIKRALVGRNMENVEVLKNQIDGEGAMCCLVGTLRHPKR